MNDSTIREWARATGLPVGKRGRIPSVVVQAYMEAHPDAEWSRSEHKPIAQCGCGRAWTGHSQAHCSTCHLHFSTVSNFDRHRPGKGCLGEQELVAGGVLKMQWGPYGITWVGAEDRPDDIGGDHE